MITILKITRKLFVGNKDDADNDGNVGATCPMV